MTQDRLQIYESWTRPETRTRARTSETQVQGEHASSGCVVPIAATDGKGFTCHGFTEVITVV